MDLNKFVVKDDMIDYVLHMYGGNWQVHDAIADDILDDLLKIEWEKQKRVKCKCKYGNDKRKVTQMKIHDLLEKRIEKVGQHLNKEKQIMHINKGKEKMVMERYVVIIEADTSYDYFPWQTTCDESFDHNPFQATFDESYDHNPFQVTSDDTSDDTLKSSSEDTCSSDCTWEQKKASKEPGSRSTQTKKNLLKVNKGQGLQKQKQKKLLFHQRLHSGMMISVQMSCYNLATNSEKEFGMKSSKENVGGSLNVRMQGKRKML
nr:hypothetical protein [Tanacetum cinerariifolium]